MKSSEGTAAGFAQYVHTVADQLGDEVILVDSDANSDLATAIIMVAARVPDLAEHELLLAWDEVNGWALRIHTDGDGDTTAVAYLGDDILPSPAAVRLFFTQAVIGAHPGSMTPPQFRRPNEHDDLEQRLALFR